uniref:Glycoside hydrolase family 2 protein n=1 Tax=Arundo donax TaxID=35708 RepID=A0A0A9FTJ3_ARUDO
MILISLHHANNTIKHSICPDKFQCRMFEMARVIKATCLDVGFIYYIKTKYVT